MKITSFLVSLIVLTCFNAQASEPVRGLCTGTSLPYGEDDSIQEATKEALKSLGTCLETSQSDCMSFGGISLVESPDIDYVEKMDFSVAMASQRVTCFFEEEEPGNPFVVPKDLLEKLQPFLPENPFDAKDLLEKLQPFLPRSGGLRDEKPQDGMHQDSRYVPDYVFPNYVFPTTLSPEQIEEMRRILEGK